jgi:ATP-dependent exoDNAse (exonuclease V) beta subunit
MNIPKLKMHTVKNHRFYETPNSDFYPSITTILGSSQSIEKKTVFEAWQKSYGVEKAKQRGKDAANKGTNVHLLIERHLKGEDLQLKNFTPVEVNSFNALKFKLKNILVYFQEIALYSDELTIAGTCDCVGDYKGIPSIIDFKTSINTKNSHQVEDYRLQITFYALAFNELFGTDIQQGVILMTSENGIPQEFIFQIEPYIQPLKERIKKFYIELEKTL